MKTPEGKEPFNLDLEPDRIERINNLMSDPLFKALRAVLGKGRTNIGSIQTEINDELAERGYNLMDIDIAHKVIDGRYRLS